MSEVAVRTLDRVVAHECRGVKALIGELFPSAGHPWLEKFLIVINDPASGAFHHAMADERVHVLYCHDKEIGMCGSSQKSEKALCNRNN